MPALARPLYERLRAHAPALLADVADPHDELLALVWGPRFDREHALGLMARQRGLAPQALHGLLDVAERYDGLGAAAQQRLRRLIQRHRATSHVTVHATVHATMAHHAPHPAD